MIVASINHIVAHWIRSVADRLTRTDTAETVVIHHSLPPKSWESAREERRLRCYLEIGVG